MNKADLVNLVAARTELTKTDVSLVVDAAIDTIIDSVVEGKKVSILGFGSFEPRDRSARQGLNPKTGEKIAIPAKRVPAFTAGKLFKDRVQGWVFKEAGFLIAFFFFGRDSLKMSPFFCENLNFVWLRK